VLVGVVTAAGLGGLLVPSQAASGHATLTAPYTAADRSTHSCPPGQLAPMCSATADADAAHGRIAVTASVDSGASGRVPSTPTSADANGQMWADLDTRQASLVTVTFHVRVAGIGLASTDDGRANVVLWATGQCDGCPTTTTTFAVPTRDGDQTLVVRLQRGQSSAQAARLLLAASAGARLDCHDFCVTTVGTARATATVTVTSIDAAFS
jgi:hypothetical protein